MTALIRTVKPWQGVYIYLFIPPHSSLQLLLQWFFLVHFCLALVPCGFRFWFFFLLLFSVQLLMLKKASPAALCSLTRAEREEIRF